MQIVLAITKIHKKRKYSANTKNKKMDT